MKSLLLKKRLSLLLILPLMLALLAYVSFAAYRLIKWNAYWYPTFVQQSLFSTTSSDDIQHLMFVVADHYEPGFESEAAIRANEAWLADYRNAVAGKTDSYGNRFVYNWFYPFDQRNDEVLQRLQAEVERGAGELEFHWHKPCLTAAEYHSELTDAVSWFQSAGAFQAHDNTQPRFAFIAGNWDLDNGRGTGCGVDNEISQLAHAGGYMDMTYSTLGSPAQPRKMINQLYYVEDTYTAKSYEQGTPVKVGGQTPDDPFLMFQGPLSFHWDLSFEYGALESYALPSLLRIQRWIDSHIHVQGKPEWSFVKLYSHGIQSPDIVQLHLGPMLDQLKREVEGRGIKLHYVSARQAYNIVRAAEAGLSGDPQQYRDYIHPAPVKPTRAGGLLVQDADH